MKKRVIDREEALTLMEKAVIERGENWVYPKAVLSGTCAYFMPSWASAETVEASGLRQDSPACLVGLALSYVGLTKEIIGNHNESGVDGVMVAVDDTDDIDWTLSEDAKIVFEAAQHLQDNEATWGDTLNAVREIS